MRKKNIIFMGTPDTATIYLQSLIDNKYNIVAAYTQPPRKKGRGMQIHNSPVHAMALDNNISTFHPKSMTSLNELKILDKLNPDIIIVMGYGMILPKKIINIPKYGCINIHVSLLPRWRGAAPVEHAILNGDKKTGVSIFQLSEKLDSGPIIASTEVFIDRDITKGELNSQLNTLGAKLLIETLPDLLGNKIFLKNQENTKSTYAYKITARVRKINFNDKVIKVYNHIRAFSPKPSAWFTYKNERIKIINCSMEICDSKPSFIINDQFHIGCANGKIIPKIIQREGKRPMEINEFLRGFKFTVDQKINA